MTQQRPLPRPCAVVRQAVVKGKPGRVGVEVNGKVVTPTWEIHQEVPACNSRAEAVDAQTLEFTWSTKWRGASDENNYDVDTSAWPRKWWSAEQPGVTEEA